MDSNNIPQHVLDHWAEIIRNEIDRQILQELIDEAQTEENPSIEDPFSGHM